MRMHLSCMHCGHEQKILVLHLVELTNDLVAKLECTCGKVTYTFIGEHKPEALYLSALHAFEHGCYSEAVTTFTASLERMYELFIKSYVCHSLMRDSKAYEEDRLFDVEVMNKVEELWKSIGKLSERQFGAFCALYYLWTGKAWTTQPKMLEFRNKIVHAGHIATMDEAFQYAEYATRLLNEIWAALIGELKYDMGGVLLFERVEAQKKCVAAAPRDEEAVYAGMGRASILNWDKPISTGVSMPDWKPVSFFEAWERYVKINECYKTNANPIVNHCDNSPAALAAKKPPRSDANLPSKV